MSNLSVVTNPHNFEVKRDGNGQEYVETCGEWVRATLVMFDDEPHIRIQEHHEAGGGRLHLGPLIPLREWFAFKENVDRLVGPYVRDPRTPLSRRTLSGALEYSILEVIAVLSERRRQAAIGGWNALVRDRIPEPAENNELLFAFKRLWKRGILRLMKPGGSEYSGNPADDRWFFFTGPFDAEITPEGWSHWESLRG
jgi:extradiol dioxygenase family protein